MEKRKLLVVDDLANVREYLMLVFQPDFWVFGASDEEEALRMVREKNPDLVFLDIDFDGSPQGWKILRQIKAIHKNTVVVVMTGSSHHRHHPDLKYADGFFDKPPDLRALRAFLNQKGLL